VRLFTRPDITRHCPAQVPGTANPGSSFFPGHIGLSKNV
jgi:hypothetical protein